MDAEIARLIGLLDDDSTEVAEDAKAELISVGVEVVEPLAAAVPSLERFGQLSAIEVFEHFGDPGAGPVLIDLLSSEHDTVREWSAWAIAQLGVREAVPALRAAYRRLRIAEGRWDDSEAVAMRRVLAVLGARDEVMPPLTASLRAPAGSLDHAWPSSRLEEIINELADHGQAVLYFMLWSVIDDGAFWHGHETLDQALDRHAPWAAVVEAARESALLEAAFIPQRDNLFATWSGWTRAIGEHAIDQERGGGVLMTGRVVDTDALTKLWEQRWPGCSKVPYELRAVQDRWVRFHTLPASKRYPETTSEYETILGRHNTVLTELVTGSALLVVTAGYSDRPEPQVPGRSAETVAVHRDASYWTSACIDDDPGFESYLHLYASQVRWSPGCVDPLLRKVADDVIANVMLADTSLGWLYHPYDGGMDVIMSSRTERDVLRDRHRDWLSAHPRGL